MSEILTVEPEGIEKRIHPRALRHFRKFQADVRLAVPLEEITEADLNNHLRDDKKPEFQRDMNQITDGLRTCMDIGDEDSSDNQIKLLLFEFQTIMAMYCVKLLLRRVYYRKVKSLREEEEKREKEEQWHAAYHALNVPAADAGRYLTQPGESKKFIESIAGAVDAYLDKGQSYLKDSRANDYLFYCDQIKRRKDEEQRKLAAIASARLFSYSLNEKIDRLKASLYLEKKSPTRYFGKESRYTGQKFYGLLSHSDKNDLIDTVQAMAKKELDNLLLGDLGDFISRKHTQYYHLLPTVNYVLDDIPCLDFSFDTEIVVEAEIWLEPSQKTFGGYLFDLPVIREEHYLVQLRESKFLGYYYMFFDASKLPRIF